MKVQEKVDVINGILRESLISCEKTLNGIKTVEGVFGIFGVKELDVDNIQGAYVEKLMEGAGEISFEEVLKLNVKEVTVEVQKSNSIPVFESELMNEFMNNILQYEESKRK